MNLDTTLGTEVASAASNQMVSLWRIVQSVAFVIRFQAQVISRCRVFCVAAALVIPGWVQDASSERSINAIQRSDRPLSKYSQWLSGLRLYRRCYGRILGDDLLFVNYFNVLRTDIAALIQSLFSRSWARFFIHRLASACISSDMPQWRLVPVAPRPGRVLGLLITATALTSGGIALRKVNQILSSPLSLTMAKSLLATVMVGVLILAIAFLKPVGREKDGAVRSWPRAFRTFLIILGLLPILTALFGYIGMARFISQQIVTGAFLVTMYMGFLTGRAISEEQAFASARLARQCGSEFHFDDAALDRSLAFVAGILINLVVALIPAFRSF